MINTVARLIVLSLALCAAVALSLAAARPAQGSPALLKGLFDEAETLGRPHKSFPMLRSLRTEAVRANLYWGGPSGVAARRPTTPTNPNDPAYDWTAYDRMVEYAARYRIKVVFSIVATPAWANGGRSTAYPPKRSLDLRNFAYAAAKRYSGHFVTKDDKLLPAVRYWLAWNEPNNPVFLRPQFKRVRGRWVVQSAVEYAKICNAIQAGIRATLTTGERIACGVTSPRGNNQARGSRPSVSPLVFLRAMKRHGARGFDAYAHHPYYGSRLETPNTRPRASTAVTLGNIDVLVGELTRLYGRKRLWITEYGYQTTPQDKYFGVTYAKQASYLRQAFAIARRHPRIDMMLWFLLRDQQAVGFWQSGFYTYGMKRKPAFSAFRNVS